MKKNVILSTVAATVVASVLMVGCTSTKAEAPKMVSGKDSVKVVVKRADGAVDATANTEGKLGTSVAVKKIDRCVDASGEEKACTEVCTDANPCEVTIKSACGDKVQLNYAHDTDYTGVFEE